MADSSAAYHERLNALKLQTPDRHRAIASPDYSAGHLNHPASTVRPYLRESFTFRVPALEAAVPSACAK